MLWAMVQFKTKEEQFPSSPVLCDDRDGINLNAKEFI